MTNDIKQRIEQIKKSEIPDGYRYTRAGLCPSDWRKGVLSDVLYNEQRAVKKPEEPYWRLGIRSHAKGTFHEFVEAPETVDMDELYVVRENDLVVNITFAWEHAVALADKNDDGLLVSHRFPTYVFKEGQNPFFYKSIVIQKRFKELLALISPGGAGRNRVMSKKDFLRLPCNIPPFAEQTRITEILMQCDKVIELKQKLIDENQKLKKVLLHKMFPQKGENVPEIRFPGYTAPWEQCKLSDILDYLSNNTLSRAELSYKEGTYRNVHYGDVLIKFGEYIDAQNTDLPHIADDTKAKKFEASKLREGDIIIADTAEDEAVGKCVEIGNIGDLSIVSGLHTIPCRPKTKYAPAYLGFYLNSGAYHDQLIPLMQGIKVTSISKSALSDTMISAPKDLEEQKAIGQFFIRLDNLITLHQRELQEWQNKKKALMQLLLTGIVRVNI